MKTIAKFLPVVALLLTINTKAQTLKISESGLKDKIAGGWAGKMIGVTYGAPSEFAYQERINEDEIKWKPEDIKGSIWQDDLYVQLTFLMAMDKYGMDAPVVKFQEMLAKAGYPLWCANMQARKNYFDGIYAPSSGDPKNSYRADDIDFQIEADYIGFMNPGMPQNIENICDKIGHIMNFGDGVYGGIFIGAMYSAAFFEKDINKVIDAGLASIPAQSEYARIVRDVIKLHQHYSNDWKAAWKELEAKWGDVDISGAGSTFNIDAKLNGAYIVMGLLYGNGDFYKTMEITTRCGQDADCNPSNAAAVLGVMYGFSKMPADWQKGVKDIGDSIFINTTYSFNTAVESTYKYATTFIKKSGGSVNDAGISLPQQKVVAPKLEVSFPNVVYDTNISIFDKSWNLSGEWKSLSENSNGKSHDQSKYAGNKNDAAELSFEGTGISLMGNWVKDGGKAEIYLDGKLQKTIDNYYDYSNQQHNDISLWHVFQLQPGKHILKVLVKGEKNNASSATNIYITRAIIYKTGLKKCDTYKFSFE